MRAVQSSRPIRVNIYYSPQAQSYWANSPDPQPGGSLQIDDRDFANDIMKQAGLKHRFR